MIELSVLGISLRSPEQTPVLLLHPQKSSKILIIDITPADAFALSSALHAADKRESAPEQTQNTPDAQLRLTQHAFILDLIHAFGGRLLAIELRQTGQGELHAEAILSSPKGIIRIVCTPIDGIALALRTRALIRGEQALLNRSMDIQKAIVHLPEHIRELVAGIKSSAKRATATHTATHGGQSPIEASLSLMDTTHDVDDTAAIQEAFQGITRMLYQKQKIEPLKHSLPHITVSVRPKKDEQELDRFDRKAADTALAVLREKSARLAGDGAQIIPTAAPEKNGIQALLKAAVDAMELPEESLTLEQKRQRAALQLLQALESSAVVSRDAAVLMPASLGLGIENGDEEDRWEILLSLLSPETKALM